MIEPTDKRTKAYKEWAAALTEQAKEDITPSNNASRIDAMNAYALRIWSGQSPDVPLAERKRRIVSGLEKQGYTDAEIGHLILPR